MRVTAVRRAQVEPIDPDDPTAGAGLSERGAVQARLLGARLATPEPPAAIYTGESDRHRATAELVATTVEAVTDQRPTIAVEDGLNDIAWTLEALEICIAEELPQAVWRDRWIAGELPIEESVSDARERVTGLVDQLRSAHDSADHLLLVTSAIPVLVLVCDAMGTAIETTDLVFANAAVTDLAWTQSSRAVTAINDTSHLPAGLVTRDGFGRRD